MRTKTLFLLSAAVTAFTACGTSAQYSSRQEYQDGIYNRTTPIAERAQQAVANKEIGALVSETQSSQIFLRSGQSDTLYVPENGVTSIQFNNDKSKTVTVFGDTDTYIASNPWHYQSSYW